MSTKVAACELPLYVGAIWLAATRFGIEGVAAVWAARAALDAVALFTVAHALLPPEPRTHAINGSGIGALAIVCAFVAGGWVAARMVPDAAGRFAVLAALLAVLLAWEWRVLLGRDDRENLRQLCNRLLASPAR